MTDTHAAMEREIRPLPTLVVNQIAAGEVVERPASVVKELVENALDAGATRIEVELEQGGIELVRVTDDGRGIDEAELPLAYAPHATSKIRGVEDLDRIGSMGFRGEALASIASVARVTIRSRLADASGASELSCEGGVLADVRPASGPPGTCVTVRNLFFNTPARRKFLRTAGTEQSRCREWLEDLAMARPHVAFTLRSDGRASLELGSQSGPRRRAVELLGRELEPELLEVSLDEFDDARGVTIWGLVGRPSIARGTNKAQHLFVNGRAVRDRTIQHALREAFRGLIEPSRHPTAVLMIEVAPESVDVNVHPQKLEVRFRDQSSVHSAVLRAVREALRRADLTPAYQGRSGAPSGREILPEPSAPASSSRSAFVDYFRSEVPARAGQPLDFDAIRRAVTDSHASHQPPPSDAGRPPPTAPDPADQPTPMLDTRPASRVLQVHNSFIVTQDEQGLLIVDQHALHERVMFEELAARVMRGPLESQRLLAPSVFEADARRIERLADLTTLLERIGVEAQAIGPRSVAIHAFPTFLFDRGVDPVAFLEELLDRTEDHALAPQGEEALHEVLDMMACKAAVKAGDRLQDTEIEALLAQRGSVERSSNCPHGRPTSIRLSIGELERLFGRT